MASGNDPTNIPYIIAENGFYYVAYKEKVKVPEIVVSAKGVANGLSEEYNDGWDFGPDSYDPNSTASIPYTQTSGIQEALTYAGINPTMIFMRNGDYTINSPILYNSVYYVHISGESGGSGIGGIESFNRWHGVSIFIGSSFPQNEYMFTFENTTSANTGRISGVLIENINLYGFLNSSNPQWANGIYVHQPNEGVIKNIHMSGFNIAYYVDGQGSYGAVSHKDITIESSNTGIINNATDCVYENIRTFTMLGPAGIDLYSGTWINIMGDNNNSAGIQIGNDTTTDYGNAGTVIDNISLYPVMIEFYAGNVNANNLICGYQDTLIQFSGSNTTANSFYINLRNVFQPYQLFNNNGYSGSATKINVYIHEGTLTGSLPLIGTMPSVVSYGFENIESVSSTTNGTTAGTVIQDEPVYRSAYKKIIFNFHGYENDTTTNQVINFLYAFSTIASVTANTTGLTVSASTSALTITAPDATTTYTGVIVVEGY